MYIHIRVHLYCTCHVVTTCTCVQTYRVSLIIHSVHIAAAVTTDIFLKMGIEIFIHPDSVCVSFPIFSHAVWNLHYRVIIYMLL